MDPSVYGGSGHAITIIGWNDSYLDVTGDGVGDGAWVAQNSWGEYAPYFYISYYDIDVVKTFMGVLDASSKEWDNSYVDHQDYYSTPTSEVFTFYKGETSESLNNVKIFYEGFDYDTTVVNVSVSDGTNSMESTSKTLHYGINTFSFNNLELTGDKVNITVTGASSLYYHIAMFTKESEDTPNLYLYESPLNSFTNTVDNQLDYHIITKNVLNDTAYTIKVLDNTNNDITSKFTLSNKINILNNYASFTLKLNEVLDVDGFRVIVSTSNLNDNIQYNIDLKIVGTGTEADPYIISSPEDLILLDSSDAYFKLNNNIDLDRPTTSSYGIFYNSGKGWAPINFYGSLDGSGYKITNLNSTVGGLFGMLYGATVKNLKIENANIVLNSTDTNVNDNVGIFAKIIYNKSNVSNISIDNGYIKGLNGTGGLCGVVYSATINNIKINATITGDNIVGGITAYIIDDYNHTSDININNVFVNNSKVYGGETKYIGLLAGLLSYYGDATGYLPANDLSNNRYNTIAVNDYKNAEDTFGFTAYTIDNDTTNYNPFETDIKSNNNQVLSNADKILTASYTNFDLDTLWSVGSEGAYLKLFYTPEELAVVSLLYKNATITEDNYILGVSPKTGLNTAESNITIDSGLTYKIYNRNGNLISSTTATIGTGGYIEITNGYEFKDYEIIVYGDVTGDGKISISDILNMADYSIASSETKETIFPLKSQIIAADVNKDSKISISDVFKVADYSINPALGF